MIPGGPTLPTPPGTTLGPPGRPPIPATPARAPRSAPPPAPAGPATQVAAFVTVSLAIGAVAAAAQDPTLVGFGVGGLFVGVCFGLGLRLDRLFRVLPGWFDAIVLTTIVGLVWAVAAPTSAVAAWVALPTLLLLVTGLDWSLATRLRTVALLSGLLAVPVVAAPNVPALLLGLGWFLAALSTCWATLRDLRAALPRPRPARPSAVAELAPSTPGELLRLVSVAAVGALALALLIGTPSCDPQPSSDVTSPPSGGAGGGSGGRSGGAGGGGASGGQTGNGRSGAGSGQLGPGGERSQGGGSSSGGGGASGGGSSGATGGGNGSGTGGSGAGGRTGSGSGRSGSATPSPAPDLTPLLAGLLLVAAAVAIALVLWPRRRRGDDAPDGPPPWAGVLVARLDAEGGARGRPRAPGETVVDHAAALAQGPLPDPRIAELGWLLSAALFSGREPPDDRRRWAEAVLDDVTAAHPVPEAPRRGRRRAEPAPA